MSSEALHMVEVRLRSDGLIRRGRELGLPVRGEDSGYLVHCTLRALFDNLAPQPFSLRRPAGRYTVILGYAQSTAAELRERADMFASPAVHSECEWEALASKPIPAAWPSGGRFCFELQACPVVRKRNAGEHHRKGAEVDVFLSQCWEVGDSEVPVDRETVYREWLAGMFDRRGGARLVSASMKKFRRRRLIRRRHRPRRTAALVERPDVIIDGELEVTDPAAFSLLLATGIGRHRAFGFGMLLLRPTKATPC